MSAPGGADAHDPGTLVVDARGLRCPLPVIRLAAAVRDLAPGTLVTVLATDPAARLDVPAWARMRGHTMAATTDPAPGSTPDAAEVTADEAGRPDAPPTWSLTVRLGGGA